MDAYREEESWLPFIAYIEGDSDAYMYREKWQWQSLPCHSLPSLYLYREIEKAV